MADEYEYNSDGTTSQLSKVLRLAGELVDSRTSKMFYQDTAKNLTRIEDPLNQDEAPTLMEYDHVKSSFHTSRIPLLKDNSQATCPARVSRGQRGCPG